MAKGLLSCTKQSMDLVKPLVIFTIKNSKTEDYLAIVFISMDVTTALHLFDSDKPD
jgi:hypothetical protein